MVIKNPSKTSNFKTQLRDERWFSGKLSSRVEEGSSAPLGAPVCDGGVNFSVFSKSATMIELLQFDDENASQPSKVIPLDPDHHRTYHYWHTFIPNLEPGQIYAYRAYGPFAPE